MNHFIDALQNYPVVEDRDIKQSFIIQWGNPCKHYGTTDLEILINWVLVNARRDKSLREYLGSLDLSTEEQLYRFATGKSSECPHGKMAKYRGIVKGFSGCGKVDVCQCAMEKMRSTNIEKYGSTTPMGSQSIREKTRQTNIRKYGVDNPAKLDHIKDKARQTNLSNRGVEYPAQDASIRNKAQATNIERYGVPHAIQNDTIREKIFETNIKRYGVMYAQSASVVKDKQTQTNKDRYGVPSPLLTDKVRNRIVSIEEKQIKKEKTSKSHQERYGEHFSRLHILPESIAILQSKELFTGIIGKKPLVVIAEELGVHPTTISNYCALHDIPLLRSSYEHAIADHLTKLGVEYAINDRSHIRGERAQELDFYIPSHHLAIEFNGLYWNSSSRVHKNYHRDKYEKCRDLGIRLVMINEDEWGQPVMEKLTNLLGKSQKGIGARKLAIKKISKTTADQFFQEHHIQGGTGTLLCAYGAFDNDVLVGAVGYNKQRTTGKIELIRFCSDGKTYPGMFSRLFHHSVNGEMFNEVLSFADLRYSQGDVYKKNGFMLVDEIAPDYRYIVKGKTFHKSTYCKKNIAKRFGIDVEGKSEATLMVELGIPRIYDCGKLKFIWKWIA